MSELERIVDGQFAFNRVKYLPMHKRDIVDGVVSIGRALLHRARSQDLAALTAWLREPHIFGALGMARAPGEAHIRRSRVPDGSGATEPIEFLVLHDVDTEGRCEDPAEWLDGLGEPVGVYICYASHRARSQEVDFTFSPQLVAANDADPALQRAAVPLLRAGRIAVLTYQMALCGAERVTWRRRRFDAKKRAFQADKHEHEVTVPRFVATLERLARAGAPMPVIVQDGDRHSFTDCLPRSKQ